MIEVLKLPKLVSNETVDEIVLLNQTRRHMDNVLDGLLFFADKLQESGEKHDYTKIQNFPEFYEALKAGNIKKSDWYKNHIIEERHHLQAYSTKDVTLVDVLEYITDCVMAGSVRSDKIYNLTLSSNLLQRAFDNTVEMLKKEILIKEAVENGNST